jgi:O-antigen/teichoic acid export membrane protein
MPRLGPLLAGLHRQKLTRDILYSLFSFAVLAASGLIINLVITTLRDAAALGVFNQAYAIYILCSQVATWGLHYSVLRHAALYDQDPAERGRVVSTAAVCAVCGGLIVGALLFAAEPWVGGTLESERTGAAIANAALGLALFPLNKVLLNYLNALRHMRAYSLLQAGRYISIMAFVAWFAATDAPIERSTLAFLGAEIVTAIAAFVYLGSQRDLASWSFSPDWTKRHLNFGGKGLIAGMFAEFNSRIDVLLIGLFLSDRAVGVYSFAAMLADGVYHVLAMIRINFNPLLVQSMRDGDWQVAGRLLQTSKRYVAPGLAVLAVLLLLGFWVFVTYLMPDKGLAEGLPALAILLAGLVVVAALVPFDNLLLVTGHPGYQTVQQMVMVTANVVVGLMLLPVLGIEGVAVGTALSYVASIATLILLSQRLIGWNLLANRFRN